MLSMKSVLVSLSFAALLFQGGSNYKVMDRYPVPGVGGFDYVMLDGPTRRLYVSHSTQVEVVDADNGKLVGTITDTPGVHGVAIATAFKHGFTSNGREGTVSIFDIKTLATSSKVKVGDNPDAILYDPATKRVFTFNGRSKNATVIDATNDKVVGNIPLDGKPEFGVADGKGGVFVNIEDKSELTAIDPAKLAVTVKLCSPVVEVSIGLAAGTGPAQVGGPGADDAHEYAAGTVWVWV